MPNLTTAKSVEVSDAPSLEHVFDTFVEKFASIEVAGPADALSCIAFDLNISYQPAEKSEKRGIQALVLVGHRRKELLERATGAAKYYINYSVTKQFKENLGPKYSASKNSSAFIENLGSERKNMLKGIEQDAQAFRDQLLTYSEIPEDHVDAFSELFKDNAFIEFKTTMDNITEHLRPHYRPYSMHDPRCTVISGGMVDFLDYSLNKNMSSSPLDINLVHMEEDILDGMSERLDSLLIPPNKQKIDRNGTTKSNIPHRCRECISNLLVNYYALDKLLSVINSSSYNKSAYIKFSEKSFCEAMSELQDRLTNPDMSEEEKKAEFRKIITLFLTPMKNSVENRYKLFKTMFNGKIKHECEYMDRWNYSRWNDTHSPYNNITDLVESMFNSFCESSHMISSVNESNLKLYKRPKLTLEFKVKDSDASSGAKEVSFDLTFRHPHKASKNVKVKNCPVSDYLRSYILSKGFLLNSSRYDEITKEGLESEEVKKDYSEMIMNIFQDRSFFLNILGRACSGITSNDYSAILRDYEKFIPLYLYVDLIVPMRYLSSGSEFTGETLNLSKMVIVPTKEDEEEVSLGEYLSTFWDWMYEFANKLIKRQ